MIRETLEQRQVRIENATELFTAHIQSSYGTIDEVYFFGELTEIRTFFLTQVLAGRIGCLLEKNEGISCEVYFTSDIKYREIPRSVMLFSFDETHTL